MPEPAARQRMSWPVRLFLLLLAVAAGTVVAWVLLPREVVQGVLAAIYSAGQYDLADRDLLETWKWILSGACGLVLCLVLAVLMLLFGGRPRDETPRAIKELQRALQQGDRAGLEAACRKIGTSLGDEAVPPILHALTEAKDEETRRQLAATLYQLGRAVTAEVQVHPGR